jgi:hypothetical protein
VKALGLPVAVAAAGVALLGLVAGDPRGAPDLDGSQAIVLCALVLALVVGGLAWRAGRRSGLWLPPALLLAIVGALSGWIAGVEISGHAERVAHLRGGGAGEALFLAAMTAMGMALPPTLLAALGRRRAGAAG